MLSRIAKAAENILNGYIDKTALSSSKVIISFFLHLIDINKMF